MAEEKFQTALAKIRNDAVGWSNESVVDAIEMMQDRASKIQAGTYGADELAADWARTLSMVGRDVARFLNLATQSVAAATLLPVAAKPDGSGDSDSGGVS